MEDYQFTPVVEGKAPKSHSIQESVIRWIAVWLISIVSATWGPAVFADSEFDFDIPPQRASSALNLLGQQSNEQILYLYDEVQGITTQAVVGRYTLDTAIRRMLEGTGLVVRRNDRGVLAAFLSGDNQNQSGGSEMNSSTVKKSGVLAALVSVFGSQAQAQGDESGLILDEVIVTAEKRESTVQETPLSITAFSGDAIREANIKDARDLANFVPNLNIGEQGNSSSVVITLRGVSSNNNNPVGDPAVAFHVDGVYYARSSGANALFFDLERLEVLRGPQGTLWGRNATAGSINVVTAKPKENFESSLEGIFGNYNRRAFQGMVNVPFADSFSIRASFATDDRDGYQKNINPAFPDLYDADDMALRLHGLYTPNDQLSVLLSANYFDRGGVGTGLSMLNDNLPPSQVDSNVDAFTEIEAFGFTGQVDYAFENMDFVSITSIRSQEDNTFRDFDGNSIGVGSSLIYVDHEAFSQEFRLASNGGGNIEWLLGAFYMKEDTANATDAFIDFAPGPPAELTVIFDVPNRDAETYAIFGQSSFRVSDDVTLTAGLRYTEDEKSNIDGMQTVTNFMGTNVNIENFNQSWTKTTWKLGADWQLNDDQMLYTSIGTGYKAGGANFGGAIYDPENLLAWELGSKNRFLEDRAQLNVSVFYYDYEDLQVTQVVNAQSFTQNAASSTIWGIETEFQFLLSDAFSVDGSVSYLNGEYDNYVAVSPLGNVLIDVSGNNVARAPEFSVNLGVEYGQELFNGELKGRLDIHHQTEVFMSEFNDIGAFAAATQGDYSRVDLSIRYESNDSGWYAEAYADNLNDEDILTHNLVVPGGGFQGSFAPPRTYGIKLGMSWE